MELYFIVFGLLWASAFFEYILKKKYAVYLSIFIAYIFTAFRFETGNDWPIYLRIFDNVEPLLSTSLSSLLSTSTLFNKEFLFVFFNSALKQLWGEFQVIIVATSTLYFYSFFHFLKAINATQATVFAASFSWLIFSVFFSTISQSLAISFFLLFWVANIQQHSKKAALFAILSVSFQVSAVIYFIIFFLARKIPSRKTLLIGWAITLIIILGKIDIAGKIIEVILSFMSSAGLGGVSNKISYYLFERGLILNNFDQAFVLLSTIVIGGWLLFKKKLITNLPNPQLYGYAIYFILFQGLFISHVVFRYRLLYVAFPIIFFIIFFSYKKSKMTTRLLVLLLSFMVSISYVALYLNKRDSITFIPYQNYLYFKVFSDVSESTGHQRSRKMLEGIKRTN